MNGDNGTRLLGDFLFDAGRINIIGVGIDINKDRPCAKPDDTTGRCEKGKRRRDHFVTRFDVQSHQTDKQCIGSARQPDCMLAVAICSNIFFKLRHGRPESKSLRLANLVYRLGDFIPDGHILRL